MIFMCREYLINANNKLSEMKLIGKMKIEMKTETKIKPQIKIALPRTNMKLMWICQKFVLIDTRYIH